MSEILTDEQFGEFIEAELASARLTDYDDYNNMYFGNFDALDLPAHIEDCLKVDLATKYNMCKPVVDTKVQYICGAPLSIEVKTESNEEFEQTGTLPGQDERSRVEEFLYGVYRNNGLLYRNMIKAIRVMAKKGDVFVRVWFDEAPKNVMQRLFQKFSNMFRSADAQQREFTDKFQIRVLKPDDCFPRYESDDYESLQFCAFVYTDFDELEGETRFAQVWYPELFQLFVERTKIGGKETAEQTEDDKYWEKLEEDENPYGFIPIIHIKNGIDDTEFGTSDLHVMQDLQYLLVKTATDMWLTMDYTAFQRVFITGAMTKSGTKYDVSPGTVVELPDKDAKVIMVEGGSVEGFLAAIKELKSAICEVTQTPQIALGTIESGVPSGYALKIHYQPLENKCNETKALLQDAFQRVNWMLFAIAAENGAPEIGFWDTEIRFQSGIPTDDKMLTETLEKQINMEIKSRTTAMQEIGIEDIAAEKRLIEADSEDIYGGVEGDRVLAEAEALTRQLEEGGMLEGLIGTPRPEEVETETE